MIQAINHFSSVCNLQVILLNIFRFYPIYKKFRKPVKSFRMIKLVISILLLIAVNSISGDESATAQCVCPYIYLPVCGSDSKTYSNQCLLNCARKNNPSLSQFSEGMCPEDENEIVKDQPSIIKEKQSVGGVDGSNCICTMDYKPVCASNGKTYGNPCTFTCAQKTNPSLTLVTYSGCLESKAPIDDAPKLKIGSVDQVLETCICTREWQPVCGNNMNTYSNPCQFECAQKQINGLEMLSLGSCEDTLIV